MQKLKSSNEKELEAMIFLALENSEFYESLRNAANETRILNFGNGIYIRGLVEISDICKRDCLYCGIRKSNTKKEHYRMTPEEIINTCVYGYENGFRTFVLQGGEDGFFTDEILSCVIGTVKSKCAGCAITLSLGERSYQSYQSLKIAGGDRYLLRHESADEKLYAFLHPAKDGSCENRKNCLYILKNQGWQIGAGLPVGTPGQENIHLARDLIFMRELNPHMVGIGPFIPAKNTPFENEKPGSVKKTLLMLALTRLMLPRAMMPATTALSTANADGTTLGILSGANVVMLNITPEKYRKKYLLYEGKDTNSDTFAQKENIKSKLHKINAFADYSRGDARLD